MNEQWAGVRVLVTGGTGFLGQHLTRRLVALGAQVTVVPREGPAAGREVTLPPGVDHRDGDVCHGGQMRHLVADVAPEIIFHLAAVGANEPFVAEERALQVNVYGTLHVLRAARHSKPRRLVVAGTSYEYGAGGALDPGNVYAASKVAAWAFCRMYHQAYATPVVVARPFNVYGPGQDPRALIPSAIRAALDGQDFPTTPGEQRRDFIYVDDLIQGFLALALAEGIEGQSLDLGTGVARPVRDVVERVFSLVGALSAVAQPEATQPGAALGRPLIGALPYRPGVVWEMVAAADRTAQLTGWRARTALDAGLRNTIVATSAP